MKVLKSIWPLFFLLLSVAFAVSITVQIRECQKALPGGILAVWDKESGKRQDFLIVEKEDGSPLYKNEAIERIQREYGIIVSEDELTELIPIKSLLSQSWKLYLTGVYFLLMLCIWKAAMRYIVKGYTECKNQEIFKTTVRIGSGAFLYLISVGIWYLLICFIDIPQQYLPIAGIWDVGYIVDEVRGFYDKVQKFKEQVPVLRDAWRTGRMALSGYGASILVFLPGWMGIICRKNIFSK